MNAASLKPLLEGASTIELVDWPHQDVPATLLRAGYCVVGREPGGHKRYVLRAAANDAERSFPLADGAFLASEPLEQLPSGIDIVNTYRPAEEQADIARHAISVGARAFWVQPGEATSDEARKLADAAGLAFVENVSIADAVRDLGITKRSHV